MLLGLHHQVAVVTGASSGIGQAIALTLKGEGAQVVANYLRESDDLETLHQQQIESYKADMTDRLAVNQMADYVANKYGHIDIWINNAGILLEQAFLDTSETQWDAVINHNLKSTYLGCHAALTKMQARKSGVIINIASELAYLGRETFAAYCASKAAIIGLTKSLAREFSPDIRINCVAPGPTDTAMLSLANMSPEWAKKELAIPAQRAAQPAEIAATVAFLSSHQANFYYGQTLSPNGGALML